MRSIQSALYTHCSKLPCTLLGGYMNKRKKDHHYLSEYKEVSVQTVQNKLSRDKKPSTQYIPHTQVMRLSYHAPYIVSVAAPPVACPATASVGGLVAQGLGVRDSSPWASIRGDEPDEGDPPLMQDMV